MPYAPEIEIVKTQLKSSVLDKRVEELRISPQEIEHLPKQTPLLLQKACICGIRRSGSLLILDFDVKLSLIINLKTSGSLRLWQCQTADTVQPNLLLHLNNGDFLALEDVSLHFIHLVPTQALERTPVVKRQGVDVLSTDFSYKILIHLCDS